MSIAQISVRPSYFEYFSEDSNPEKLLMQNLSAWLEAAPPENRMNQQIAVNRIQECYAKKSPDLNLSNLSLISLPDSVRSLEFLEKIDLSHNKFELFPESLNFLKGLKELDLSYNLIGFLPESISFFEELENLHLHSNKLRFLPSEIRFLKNLQKLHLSDNQLTSLPESIGSLGRLKVLSLRYNKLSRLPESIGSLKSLQMFFLTRNELTSLPESIGSLSDLYYLYLGHNELTSLPESIASLQNLQRLYLSSNQLRLLPQIGSLGKLESLDLENNPLIDLPTSITDLSRLCNIGLMGCNFLPLEVLNSLKSLIQNPAYQGPHFTFPTEIREESLQSQRQGLLGEIYQALNLKLSDLTHLQQTEFDKNRLEMWLSKLPWTADWKNAEQKQKLLKKIAEFLELAETDESFRTTFFEILDDANSTCGDRISLSIINLGIAQKLIGYENNLEELSQFLLNHVRPLEHLIKIAEERITQMICQHENYDEISIILAYLLKIGQKLGLDLEVSNMLYFQTTDLSRDILNAAYDEVVAASKSRNEAAAFLGNNSYWRKAFEKECPSEYGEALASEDIPGSFAQKALDYLNSKKRRFAELV